MINKAIATIRVDLYGMDPQVMASATSNATVEEAIVMMALFARQFGEDYNMNPYVFMVGIAQEMRAQEDKSRIVFDVGAMEGTEC